MRKGKLYIGRFLEKRSGEDGGYYYSFRVGRSENIDSTIEEYGINKEWSLAKQVLTFWDSEEFVLLYDVMDWSMKYDEGKELIYYDLPFPKMGLEHAIGIISNFEYGESDV
jgi:hypothetical protein